MSLSSQVITSSWAECSPVTVSTTQTVYTTVWTTHLLAANEFSAWDALYTITEIRTGNPADYVRPAFPPCFVETSVHCGRCADEGEDIIITAPAATMTEGVTVDGDGVVASAALGQLAEAGLPIPTPAPDADITEDDEEVDEEFPPTEPQDIQPDIAGGDIAPPGAAPFPTDEGAEFRGVGADAAVDTATTAQGVLPIIATADLPEASGEPLDDAEAGARIAGDTDVDTDGDSALTMDDVLPLLSGLTLSDFPSITALSGLPEVSVEPEGRFDPLADPNFPSDTDIATEADPAVAEIDSEADALSFQDAPFVASDADAEVDADPSFTLEGESSFSTIVVPEASGEVEFRIQSDSIVTRTINTERLATASATASASASSAGDSKSNSDHDSKPEFRTSSTGSDSESDSGVAPGHEEGDGFTVTAAAQRVPTQSTTLLAMNALLVGLWVLL